MYVGLSQSKPQYVPTATVLNNNEQWSSVAQTNKIFHALDSHTMLVSRNSSVQCEKMKYL